MWSRRMPEERIGTRTLALTSRAGSRRPVRGNYNSLDGARSIGVKICAKSLVVAGLFLAALFATAKHLQFTEISQTKDSLQASEVSGNSTAPSKMLKGKEKEALDMENMDQQSVRLRWTRYPDKCLGVWNENISTEYKWKVWECYDVELAWYMQRYLLPPLGEVGQIVSEVGHVHPNETKYCLTVPFCVIGTHVVFRPCGEPGLHTEFRTERTPQGAVRIRSLKCPPNMCVDMPNKNTTNGNLAQIWDCKDEEKTKLLETDEGLSVGVSTHDEEVFQAMNLYSRGAPPSCLPQSIRKLNGFGGFQVRCPTSGDAKPIRLALGFSAHKTALNGLNTYSTVWILWCSHAGCECKAHNPATDFASMERNRRERACGVAMLTTVSNTSSCPAELENIRGTMNENGKVDCPSGLKATEELKLHPLTNGRLDLMWMQATVSGILPADVKAFEALTLRHTNGSICNCTEPKKHDKNDDKKEDLELEVTSVLCPSDKNGRELGLEMHAEKDAELSSGISVWSLWCVDDSCACKPARPDQELVSARMELGEEACGVVMLSTSPRLGGCPAELVDIRHVVEGDDEVDCEAGREKAAAMAADEENESRLKLKWVAISREESAIDKLTKAALDVFGIIGGIVVVGTVPAWPAVAKFTQFLVMMASTHTSLGIPAQFNSFARKFTKFDDLVKPLKHFKLPGLRDLGIQFDFLASSKWFLLKEKLLNQSMQQVVKTYNDSGMISPGSACFLSHYYDPARRSLRNITEVLESNGGVDPCTFDELDSEANLSTGARRLKEATEEDEFFQADTGSEEEMTIRKRWEQLHSKLTKPIDFLERKLERIGKDFSITKSLLFCLLVLPSFIAFYLLVYIVLWLRGHKLSFIPYLHPRFLLVFLADIALLNIVVAWANVMFRRRLLQCENPFRLMDEVLEGWEGLNINAPITSAQTVLINCFRPIISLFAIWDGLHINLEDSKVVATIVFLLGPCFIFLLWLLHWCCAKLGRHPTTNRFMDQECRYLKAHQPVLGSRFQKQLFYELPQVSQISKVIATNADGTALYKDSVLQQDTKETTLVHYFPGCFKQEEKEEVEGHEIKLTDDQELAKMLSDGGLAYDWAFRSPPLDVGTHGLPATLTLAFTNSGGVDMDELLAAEKPHARLRVARGNQVVSMAFQVRAARGQPHLPLMSEVVVGTEGSKAFHALELELLQSVWRRRLQDKFKMVIDTAGQLEVGYLRWTMWDTQEGQRRWILAGMNVLLRRKKHNITDAKYVELVEQAKATLQKGLEKWGNDLLQDGWRETRRILDRWRCSLGCAGGRVDEDSHHWRKIAEQHAAAVLAAREDDENILPEVDLTRSFVANEGFDGGKDDKKKDKKEGHDEEGEGRENRHESEARAEPEPEAEALDAETEFRDQPGEEGHEEGKPHASPQGATDMGTGSDKTNASFQQKVRENLDLTNISAAASFEDERMEKLTNVKASAGTDGDILLAMTSEFLKTVKHGDIVEVWVAGEREKQKPQQKAKAPPAPGSQEESMTQPLVAGEGGDEQGSGEKASWHSVIKGSTTTRLLRHEITPWEHTDDPYREVMVLRERPDGEEWLKAIRKFPDAHVGKVEVPLQLQAGFGCKLRMGVCAKDLIRLKEEVPITVPFGHLQLKKRDRWRIFYLGDHRKHRDESPQIHKIMNSLHIMSMVLAVVVVPPMPADPLEEKQEKDKWAEACQSARGSHAHKCNPDSPEFQDMTAEARRSQDAVTGLSLVLLALAAILLLRVVLNAFHDNDLRCNTAVFKNIWNFIQAEIDHIQRIFRGEKRTVIVVRHINYTKVTSDPKLQDAFSRIVKKAVGASGRGGVLCCGTGRTKIPVEEIKLEIAPHADPANPTMLYVLIDNDEREKEELNRAVPQEVPVDVELRSGQSTVKLIKMWCKDAKEQLAGCRPDASEEHGVGKLLNKTNVVSGQTPQQASSWTSGWGFQKLRKAYEKLEEAIEQVVVNLGAKEEEKKIPQKVVAFQVDAGDASYEDLEAAGVQHVFTTKLEEEVSGWKVEDERAERKVKSSEMTCTEIKVTVTLPHDGVLNFNDIQVKLDNQSDDDAQALKKKVRIGEDFKVQSADDNSWRWPTWLTLNFVLNFLKLLLVIFIGVICLANGGTWWQGLAAMSLGLLFWFLSRLTFDSIVDDKVFKSSTKESMEVGQVALVLVPLCCQLNIIDDFSGSVMMIIGVLWALITLCCKYLQNTIKKFEKKAVKWLTTQTKRLKKATKMHSKAKNFDWDIILRPWVRVRHQVGVMLHGLSATTRDPAWLFGLLFTLLFCLSLVAISSLQTHALAELSLRVTGQRKGKLDQLRREVPGLLTIFAVALGALVLCYLLFFTWLPNCLQSCREGQLKKKLEETATESVKAIWADKEPASAIQAEDKKQCETVEKMLYERSRAYPLQAGAEPKTEGGDAVVEVEKPSIETDGKSVLFDPLGGLIAVSDVPVFADDGASVMQGALVLENGCVPMKRLLCTARAWASPRSLVTRTPVQVRLRSLTAASAGQPRAPLAPGEEVVPEVEVRGMTGSGSEKLKVLVGTIQIVNFVNLTIGKTDRHDGVLSLWRSADPTIDAKGQLLRWFEEVRAFFDDYGAGFEKGSHVYEIMEGLFWGVKDFGESDSPPPTGAHLQGHKKSYMVSNKGSPYAPWLDRNMADIVKRLSPPPKVREEPEYLSDDEEKEARESLTDEEKAARRKSKLTQDTKKGLLEVIVENVSGLPKDQPCCACTSPGPAKRRWKCVAKTPTNQTFQGSLEGPTSVQPTNKAENSPQSSNRVEVVGFVLNETELSFKVWDANDELGSVDFKVQTKDLSGTTFNAKKLEMQPEKAGGSCSENGRMQLEIKLRFTEEGKEPPSDEGRTVRPPAADGFCGGPLAWQLLYPMVAPLVLHVVVTAEDLRVDPETASTPRPFGPAPLLGQGGRAPPLREERATKAQ